MFDFLPAATPVPLEAAPLVQVIAQIRFNAQGSFSTQQGIGALHEALADQYPRLLAEQQAVITANPGGVTTTQVPQWRLTDLEGQWAIVVGPEQLSLESSAYATWDSFRDRLEPALVALDETARPRIRERLGLRYVNHLPAGEDGSFVGRVRPELLGLATVEGWRTATAVSLSQTVLRDQDTQMALRYGCGVTVVPDDVFVLDIDCSDDHPVEFDSNGVLAYFDALNDAAYRCFCFCLPAPFRSTLAG